MNGNKSLDKILSSNTLTLRDLEALHKHCKTNLERFFDEFNIKPDALANTDLQLLLSLAQVSCVTYCSMPFYSSA